MKNVEIRSLDEFIHQAQEKIDRLVKDAKSAQDAFNQCVEYFGRTSSLSHPAAHSLPFISGEVPRTQSPANFFSIFVKFQRACQVGR